MALKFLSAGGSGTTADAVRAVNYATMMRTMYGVDVRVTSSTMLSKKEGSIGAV